MQLSSSLSGVHTERRVDRSGGHLGREIADATDVDLDRIIALGLRIDTNPIFALIRKLASLHERHIGQSKTSVKGSWIKVIYERRIISIAKGFDHRLGAVYKICGSHDHGERSHPQATLVNPKLITKFTLIPFLDNDLSIFEIEFTRMNRSQAEDIEVSVALEREQNWLRPNFQDEYLIQDDRATLLKNCPFATKPQELQHNHPCCLHKRLLIACNIEDGSDATDLA
jgi:hypothetical protein